MLFFLLKEKIDAFVAEVDEKLGERGKEFIINEKDAERKDVPIKRSVVSSEDEKELQEDEIESGRSAKQLWPDDQKHDSDLDRQHPKHQSLVHPIRHLVHVPFVFLTLSVC